MERWRRKPLWSRRKKKVLPVSSGWQSRTRVAGSVGMEQ
jgi:hypothetical protein